MSNRPLVKTNIVIQVGSEGVCRILEFLRSSDYDFFKSIDPGDFILIEVSIPTSTNPEHQGVKITSLENNKCIRLTDVMQIDYVFFQSLGSYKVIL